LNVASNPVPLPTVPPPDSLVDVETNGVVTAAPAALENANAALENANIRPAIATTVVSPSRTARSAVDRAPLPVRELRVCQKRTAN
jgi:hypothetical protein